MTKLISTIALSLLLGLASASAATGQGGPFTLDLTMAPKKLGDGSVPKSVVLKGRLSTRGKSESAPRIEGWRLLLPKGFKFNGGRFPKCSAAAMSKAKSTDPCPRKSIVGLGPEYADGGDAEGYHTHQYVNGGAKRIWAFLFLPVPVLRLEPVALDVKRLKSPKWAYELSIQLPPHFLTFTGLPIGPTSFDIALGTKKGPRYFTVGKCPERGFLSYRMTVNPGAAGADLTGRLPCK